MQSLRPLGVPFASKKDRVLLKALQDRGSPQKSSEIIPLGKESTSRFNHSQDTERKSVRLKD